MIIDNSFVAQYNAFIIRCLNRYTHDSYLLDDLKSDVYLKLMESDFQMINVKGYIFTVCRSVYYDYVRKDSKIADIEPCEKTHEPEILPAIELIQTMEKLDKTSNKHISESMKLYSQGYKYREIAEITGQTIGSIKSFIFRGRAFLNKHIND